MRGVTDLLLNVANAAAASDRRAIRAALRELRERHYAAIEEALDEPADRHDVGREVATRLEQLRRLLTGVALVGELSPRSRDRIAGWGEGCLVPILAGVLREQGIPGRGEVRVRWFVRGQGSEAVLGFESDKAKSVTLKVKLD